MGTIKIVNLISDLNEQQQQKYDSNQQQLEKMVLLIVIFELKIDH